MDNYIELTVGLTPNEEYLADIMAAALAEAGFESFVPDARGLIAYAPEDAFDADALEAVRRDFPVQDVGITFNVQTIAQKNWNEEWEKHYFAPIVIGEECVIHSSFHTDVPPARYDIVIDPKMSFGTGHHETTSLMLEYILQADLTGQTVLDMGCGTSVLAILASKRGARAVTAIDIDTWCTDNSRENVELNHAEGITVLLGDASLLPGRHFDTIFANINRNILLADMPRYAACLNDGGVLYMSGFYEEDVPAIEAAARAEGLHLQEVRSKNRWTAVKVVRK